MTACYKWTDNEGYTRHAKDGELKWGEGVVHTVDPWLGELCQAGVIHCYDDSLVAVMLDQAHGRYTPGGLLWQAEWTGRTVSAPDKRGVETLKTLHTIDPPVITQEQRVEIAIRCVMVVLPDVGWAKKWREWAEKWLDGSDRSAYAADVAYAANAANAAYAAAYAADAVAYAAYAAANTAAFAAYSVTEGHLVLDIVAICHQVVE